VPKKFSTLIVFVAAGFAVLSVAVVCLFILFFKLAGKVDTALTVLDILQKRYIENEYSRNAPPRNDASEDETQVRIESRQSAASAAQTQSPGRILADSANAGAMAQYFQTPSYFGSLLSPSAEDGALRKVYLTFDDGPSIYTDDILDILDEYGVKATFFTIGTKDPKLVPLYKRIVDEGHSLGMHSFSHNYGQIYKNSDAFAADFQKIYTYLYEVTGVKSQLYRFPGGSSAVSASYHLSDFIEYLHSQGVEYFDWNISAMDADSIGLSALEILNNCTVDIERFDSAVILMHDSADKASTVEALPLILDRISKMNGVVVLPITGQTTAVQHRK